MTVNVCSHLRAKITPKRQTTFLYCFFRNLNRLAVCNVRCGDQGAVLHCLIPNSVLRRNLQSMYCFYLRICIFFILEQKEYTYREDGQQTFCFGNLVFIILYFVEWLVYSLAHSRALHWTERTLPQLENSILRPRPLDLKRRPGLIAAQSELCLIQTSGVSNFFF